MFMIQEIILAESQEPAVGIRLPLQIVALCQPIGTFAGTEDLILRVRNGYIVAADTGDQGGGQN